MRVKKNGRLFIVLTLVGIVVALLLGSKTTRNFIYYVQMNSGEELLCWDGGCGWTRGSTVGDLNLTPPTVPAIVTKDIQRSDIAVKKKILGYKHDDKQTYSSLKGYVVEGNKVVFVLRDFDKSSVYAWDKQSGKTKLIVSSAESMWPIEIQPAGNLVLIAEYNSSKQQTEETIYSLTENKRSSPMQLSTFRWGDGDKYLGSEYLGFEAKLPEYECPFYADIYNCSINVRRSEYLSEIEKQDNSLDFNWISLSLPVGWEYNVDENTIRGKSAVFSILTGPTKQNLLARLSECYLSQSNRQGSGTNGRTYQVTQFTYSKRCEYSFHDKVLVIKHKEFSNSSLVLEITPLDSKIAQSQIRDDISQFISYLSKSILY